MPSTITDNFGGSGAATAHVSDSGHTISEASAKIFFEAGTAGDAAQLVLAGGKVGSTQSGSQFPAVCYDVVLAADCFVEVHYQGNPAHNADFGLAWRYNNTTGAGYFFGVNAQPDGSHVRGYLQAWDGIGGGDIILSPTALACANPLDYVLRIEHTGTGILIFIDGVDVTPGTLTNSLVGAGGKIGFWIQKGGGGVYADCTFTSLDAGDLAAAAFWTDFVRATETV